jgi:hypothetical protein
MKLILVPHTADQQSVRLWACATDTNAPPADFAVDVQGVGAVAVRRQDWLPVTAGGALSGAEIRTFVQVVTVAGLQPATRYVGTAGAARVRFSTLPAVLPREGERPFTVLLSSCFAIGSDKGLAVGRLIAGLPEHLKPDLKFLVGDQVYLDFPAFIVGLPFTQAGLGRSLLSKYLRNWGDAAGYQALLEQGCTWFTADDHEFWNNYPNAATIISNTWTAAGRAQLKSVTLPLFGDFQCEQAAQAGRSRQFQAGSLSFFVADTRVFRQPGDNEFMQPGDLARLLDWVRTLSGPGVLVVGQPLFHEAANWFTKRVVDRHLANYEQYKELARALTTARHSILMLTGDVHFGRVASAVLLGSPGQPELIEVIGSPLALVRGSARFPPDAPDKFPPEAVAGAPQVPVRTNGELKKAGDNFAVLQFTEVPGRVKVRVRHWYIREPEGQQAGREATLSLF